MSTDQKKIGLIAGNGKFPVLFARAARKQDFETVAAGIRGDTTWFLRFFVNKFEWFRIGELKKLFRYFHDQGVTKVIMAGQVNPRNLFDASVQLDEEFKDLFEAIQDRKADTIFAAIAEKLKEYGLELLDSTYLLNAFLAPKGTLTRRGPTQTELDDIAFGRSIAKSMGGIDVGQTVVVKQKAIVAIEAMEGTDCCILRGGKIAGKGAVVVKMSKPQQDQRFDVPVIGPRTMRNLRKAKVACLAVEANKTLIIDRHRSVKQANNAGICIVAV